MHHAGHGAATRRALRRCFGDPRNRGTRAVQNCSRGVSYCGGWPDCGDEVSPRPMVCRAFYKRRPHPHQRAGQHLR